MKLTDKLLIVAVNLDTGGVFVTMTGAADTVTDFVVVALAPELSVTVNVMVKVPAVEYVWEALTPVELLLESPQPHKYDTILPSASFDADPSTATTKLFTIGTKLAVGN